MEIRNMILQSGMSKVTGILSGRLEPRLVLTWFFVLMLCPVMASCGSEQLSYLDIKDDVQSSGLRVLAIGNSFTDNGTLYMPQLLSEAYAPEEVAFVKVVKSNSSLQTHWENHESGEDVYDIYYARKGHWESCGKVSFDNAVNMATWDAVVIQQVSELSGDAGSFEPYLSDMMRYIRSRSPEVSVGWQMTWAYASSAKRSAFAKYDNNRTTMYRAIESALAGVDGKVDFIIPSGTLVENLRGTSLNDDMDLTQDGFHLQHGMPSFALSCLWHEVCIRPYTGRSCLGTVFRPYADGIDVTDEAVEVIDDFINDIIESE